ncbi:hypothetical protein [Flavobacterium taihuense]|uniref:Uncharacterized protein n=1 Tax=Flavobacterium taihuense TaxID=2857508 RepID=A0ABS6Y0K0_9FLAO|nr:hypothetical protein [Flavobacterium taihuense]MBW4362453.1 hypothetical protein [Flavobacterium taihuense]
MNLELKHLAPYLHYKIMTKNNDNLEVMLLGGLSGDTAELLQLEGIGTDNEYCRLSGFEEFKPILRPLKDLSNEITHNDKKFYPLACLLISKYPKWFVDHFDSEKYKNITIDFTGRYAEAFITYQATHSIQLDSTYILNESFNIIQKLLEWHFDVFNLIEKGLAISIHDVEQADA